MSNGIQHVFVLMLENRSFDHMLGFSGITGTDAVTGVRTEITGLTDLSLRQFAKSLNANKASGVVQRRGGAWPPPPAVSLRDLFVANQFSGQTYRAAPPAAFAMTVDPGHEFPEVLLQLCGIDGQDTYLAALSSFNAGKGAPPQYPQIENSGFVASYEAVIANDGSTLSSGQIMQCYSDPSQLPVLTVLAQEFVICDNWYCSLPGPTWPNRFFAHAASSGGLDHSPTDADMLNWEKISGFSFKNGTIFDQMNSSKLTWRVYAGDELPIVAALKGVNPPGVKPYSDFAGDVSQANYPASYTFIEPNYGDTVFSTFKCGTSQHPLDDVTRGEALIKATYEAIRNSPIWNGSLLVITWDEHGGFFDHVPPPSAVPPGDTAIGNSLNLYAFSFNQYGPRVPAVVISPLIPGNLIDHRVYDHASIPRTLEVCFGLSSMTQRDANANNLMPLVTLSNPRGDAPTVLPVPAVSGVGGCDPVSFAPNVATAISASAPTAAVQAADPLNSIDAGNLRGFLLIALRSDLALSPPEQSAAIISSFNSIKTTADASQYMDEVRAKVRGARTGLS